MTLRLHITSLGPIKEGNIELGDVTVFIGPPNSGKSTALKALYYSLKFDRRIITLDVTKLEENRMNFRFGVNKVKENYRRVISEALPEGEFSLEPINVVKFLEENKLNLDLKGNITPNLSVIPSICNDDEIKGIENFIKSSAISYTGKILGYDGYVEFEKPKIPNLSQECEREVNSRLYDSIRQDIKNEVENYVVALLIYSFHAELKNKEGIEEIRLIPYWKSLLAYEILTLKEEYPEVYHLFDKPLLAFLYMLSSLTSEFSLPFKALQESFAPRFRINYPPYLAELYNLLENARINNNVRDLLLPLISGDVTQDKDNVVYKEDNKQISWKYVSASVIELVTPLLTIGENELILYEEPETQLHEKLQLLIALFLYALPSLGNKVVITTHSQTIAYTLAHLAILKPNKEEISKLLDSLNVKNYEKLAEAIEKSNARNTSVRFYYFHDGLVKEKELKEVTAGMPGTIDVLEKELDLLSFSTFKSKRVLPTYSGFNK